MSCTGLNSINPVCVASDAISSQASDAASTAFVHIAGFFGSAAAKATEWLWQEIDSATTLDLQSPALLKEMGATAAVAAVLCLGLFVIQVIRGALGGDPSALRRAVVDRVIEPQSWSNAVDAGRIQDPGVTARQVHATVTRRVGTDTTKHSVEITINLEGPPSRAGWGFVTLLTYTSIPMGTS